MRSKINVKPICFATATVSSLKLSMLKLRSKNKLSVFNKNYFLNKNNFNNQSMIKLEALNLKSLTGKILSATQTHKTLSLDTHQNLKVEGNVTLNPSNRLFKLKDLFVRALLHRFLVSLLGSNVILCFFRNLQQDLDSRESMLVKVQQYRIFLLSPAPLRTQNQRDKYQWKNCFMQVYLSVKYRDPLLLLNWLHDRLKYMTMFAHLRFFRILGLILKLTITDMFSSFKLKGYSFYLVGKISVTGNAMSRSYRAFAGKRSNSSLALKLASQFFLVRTVTGCLGFSLSYFF